ncbi:DUF945 family protein [Acinetobacter sp. c1-l78]|uniref:DUF945 family protein n=1 Tax=Acinetobacter sp. c1-l78 TaxID=3342803 RepID=UPI0035B7E16A
MTVKSADKITRSLTGYNIHSEVHFESADKDVNQILQKLPALQSDTHVNWSGKGDTKVTLPNGSVNIEDGTMNWDNVTAHFNFFPKDKEYFTQDLTMNIDKFKINSPSKFDLGIDKFTYEDNISRDYSVLSDGKSSTKFAKVYLNSLQADKAAQFEINNIDIQGESTNKNGKLDFNMVYKIADVHFKSGESDFSSKDNIFNLKFTDLNAETSVKLLKYLEKSQNQCIANWNTTPEAQQLVLELINSGFHIESKNNQINLADGKIKADAVFTLPKQVSTDLKTAMQNAMTSASYNLQVEADKPVVNSLIALASSKGAIDAGNSMDQEFMLQQYAQAIGATVTADKVTLIKSKP